MLVFGILFIKKLSKFQNFFPVMMEESRLSMMLQKQINYHLRNGEPLPVKSPEKKKNNLDENSRALEIIRRARVAKRKSLEAIIASGAYDQQPYRPKPNGKSPSEKAKIELQEKMSGIKISSGMKALRRPSKQEIEVLTDDDRINECEGFYYLFFYFIINLF